MLDEQAIGTHTDGHRPSTGVGLEAVDGRERSGAEATDDVARQGEELALIGAQRDGGVRSELDARTLYLRGAHVPATQLLVVAGGVEDLPVALGDEVSDRPSVRGGDLAAQAQRPAVPDPDGSVSPSGEEQLVAQVCEAVDATVVGEQRLPQVASAVPAPQPAVEPRREQMLTICGEDHVDDASGMPAGASHAQAREVEARNGAVGRRDDQTLAVRQERDAGDPRADPVLATDTQASQQLSAARVPQLDSLVAGTYGDDLPEGEKARLWTRSGIGR